MRVFILGAGVSKSYGGPLVEEALPEAIKCASDTRGNKRIVKKINDLLSYAFPVDCNPEQHIYPDIETVLSTLDVWNEFNSAFQEDPKFSDWEIEEVRRLILWLVSDQLQALIGNIEENSAICKFATHLKKGDVIITFNWDLGLELAVDLANSDLDWDYFWRRDNSKRVLTILKAHGSIDWFRTEDILALYNYQKEPLDSNIGNISVIQWRSPRQRGIPKQCSPYIIPPTHFKSFKEQEIRNIWRGISEALMLTDRLYVFGYSLSPADLQARLVLRSSIGKNNSLSSRSESILIVDPKRSVKGRFEQIGVFAGACLG